MAEGSWIRRMFDEGASLKQRYGADKVFDLSLGNPIIEPPPEFNTELKKLAADPPPGMHRYMENAGYRDTRAAVAAYLGGETGRGFTADDIVMTCGAAGALNVVLKTVLNPGDEVIIFAPFFVEYLNYVDNHGGVSRVLPSNEGFLPRLDALEAAITARTRVVLINSPNNPTGIVYSDEFLSRLGKLLERKRQELGMPLYLVSDEPYRKIIFDDLKCPYVWRHYRSSIVVTSHSKDLGLPGERIGYIALHPEFAERRLLVDGFIYSNRTLGYVNAPALMQRLVASLQSVSVPVAEYQQKRDRLYNALTSMGYQIAKPQGAFYMFPRSPVPDDVAFVQELQKELVLTVPGRGFGAPGFFRLAYCVDDRTIDGSLPGFRRAIQKATGER